LHGFQAAPVPREALASAGLAGFLEGISDPTGIELDN